MKKIDLVVLIFVFFFCLGCERRGQTIYDAAQAEEITVLDDAIIANLSVTTWQEAYNALLQKYAEIQLLEMEEGYSFILHDIDQDGVPELFLLMNYETGHFRTSAVYTFTESRIISLEYSGRMTDGGIFALTINHPWIVMFYAAGSGGFFRKMQIDENKLTMVAGGSIKPNEDGDGFDYSINDIDVMTEEFERIFGSENERKWFVSHSITETNIQDEFSVW